MKPQHKILALALALAPALLACKKPPPPPEPEPAAGTVTITASPTGAAVFHDRHERLGATPLTLTRPDGTLLSLTLVKDGHSNKSFTVMVEGGKQKKVHHDLALSSGTLVVDSGLVRGGEIYVDGEYSSKTPNRVEVTAGKELVVEVKEDGYHPYLERVTVGAHYDSWDVGPCTIDNGSGTAAMLEIARVMAALGPHERTVRFVAFGAEELGIQGSIAYGLRHLADIRRLCRLMINIDIVGTTHGALSLSAVTPEVRDRVRRLIEETKYEQRTGYEAALVEFPALGTDSTPFIVLGVPTLSSGKFPYIYYHTEFDTIDKVDWSDLYATVLLNAMAAFHYANAGFTGI